MRPAVSGASTVTSMIDAISSTETFAPNSVAAIGTNTTASTDATTKRPIVYPAPPPLRSAFCGKNGGIGATASAMSATFTIGRSANCETITATNRGTITFIATSARPSFAGRLSSQVASAKLARNPIASTVRTTPIRAASVIQVIIQIRFAKRLPAHGGSHVAHRRFMRVWKLVWALLLVGCSTPTTVTEAWRDPSYSAGPMRKILVLGRTPAETNRRKLEDSMASALQRRGVNAMASYHAFQAQAPDREAVQRYLDAEHYDGALVIEFQGIRTRTIVEPYPQFGNYYGSRFQGGFYSNDYDVYTDQYVNVDTTLWNAHDDRLAWSVGTQTTNPWSSTDAITSLVGKLVSTMTREHLLP